MQQLNLHRAHNGEKPPFEVDVFSGTGDEDEEAAKSSSSARDAFRIQTAFPISVTVTDTWTAGVSRRLTGDIPELVT